MAFNIDLWSIKKVIFGSLGHPGITIATSLSGSTRDFLSYGSICFLITKF